MQTLQAAIMGAIQGLTEFLPVSSSGHIVLSSAFYKMITGASFLSVDSEEIFFDILIHLATLFAVIIYFFKDIKDIFMGFFKSLINRDFKNENFKTGVYILCATFITGVFGLIIKDFAHKLTENPFIVSILIIVTGSVLFISEKISKKSKNINLKTAFLVGLFQGLAVFPGLSRSGMTISAALLCGTERMKAARFSFILSVPIIILASLVYPLISIDLNEFQTFNLKAMIIGVLTAFIVGYICIKGFMKFIDKKGLKAFSYYCWIIGAISALVICFS